MSKPESGKILPRILPARSAIHTVRSLRSVGGETPIWWYDGLRGSRKTYEELHLGYLFIYLFHELYDEINQLMLQHLLRMEVRYQE